MREMERIQLRINQIRILLREEEYNGKELLKRSDEKSFS